VVELGEDIERNREGAKAEATGEDVCKDAGRKRRWIEAEEGPFEKGDGDDV